MNNYNFDDIDPEILYQKSLELEKSDLEMYYIYLLAAADRGHQIAMLSLNNNFRVVKLDDRLLKFCEENIKYSYSCGKLGWFYYSGFGVERLPKNI